MTGHEIEQLAKRLRYWSLRMSTQSGSGHPTSSLSAADLAAVLLSHHLRYDVNHPENLHNDRLIFSKGHASPLFYAIYEALGVLDATDLLQYRQIDSPLEGHPTPRFPHTVVSTGSLGMGLGFGAGVALGLQQHQSAARVWVLLGDGEMAEGSVWESFAFASQHELNNLTAVIDVNRLGQSGPTAYGHDTSVYEKRIQAFGWDTRVIDGHNDKQIDQAFDDVVGRKKPMAIIAKTIKGKGVSFLEDQPNWHGKALSPIEFDRAVEELGYSGAAKPIHIDKPHSRLVAPASSKQKTDISIDEEKLAVREGLGRMLAALCETDAGIRVLDGDVGNSTYTDFVKKATPDQFTQVYIAEQMMLSAAIGLSKVGFRPVVATFAAFLTRAFDQIRMAAVSRANLAIIGTHVGVSIGQDGPSQMGLEDMAMLRAVSGSIVLSPADAMSGAKLLAEMIQHKGISYIRATRGATPLLYDDNEQFPIGASKVLKSSKEDRVTVIVTGICVHEALTAYETLQKEGISIRVIDMYSIKPVDKKAIRAAAVATSTLITVEDHWYEGGLGDAVQDAFTDYSGVMPHIHKLAITEMPRSGKPEELLDKYGISARHVVKVIHSLIDK